jgi:hypothetical protein
MTEAVSAVKSVPEALSLLRLMIYWGTRNKAEEAPHEVGVRLDMLTPDLPCQPNLKFSLARDKHINPCPSSINYEESRNQSVVLRVSQLNSHDESCRWSDKRKQTASGQFDVPVLESAILIHCTPLESAFGILTKNITRQD